MVLGIFQFSDTFCAYFSIFLYFPDLCTLAWSRSVGRRRPNRGWESSRLDSDSLAWEAPQQLAVLAPYGALSIGIEVLLANENLCPEVSIPFNPSHWHTMLHPSQMALFHFTRCFAVFLSAACSISLNGLQYLRPRKLPPRLWEHILQYAAMLSWKEYGCVGFNRPTKIQDWICQTSDIYLFRIGLLRRK